MLLYTNIYPFGQRITVNREQLRSKNDVLVKSPISPPLVGGD